jgi:endopolyphosphatase
MLLSLQRLVIAAVAAAITVTASPLVPYEQKPLVGELQRPESSDVSEAASRKLTGKFLHITGILF